MDRVVPGGEAEVRVEGVHAKVCGNIRSRDGARGIRVLLKEFVTRVVLVDVG